MNRTNKWRVLCHLHGWTYEKLARLAMIQANEYQQSYPKPTGSISFFSFYSVVTGISRRVDLDPFLDDVAPHKTEEAHKLWLVANNMATASSITGEA